MAESSFINLQEVAKYFSVSVATARTWVRSGLIPCLKVGNVYRFRLPEVEAALIAHSKKRFLSPQTTPDLTDL